MTVATRPSTRIRAALAVCGALTLAISLSACDPGSSSGSSDGSSNVSGSGSSGDSSGSGSSDTSSDSSPGSASRTFDLSGKDLTIDSDRTGVDIVPGDVTGVRVQREIHGEGVEASWGLSGNTLTLKVRLECHGPVSDCSVKHTVTVPRDVTVTAESGTGAVTASHVTTPLSITTTTGGAKVTDSSGPLTFDSRTGAIEGTGLTSRKVTAEAGTGAVRLSFSAVPDDVEVDGQNGTIDIGLPTGDATYAVDAGSRIGMADVGVPSDSGSTHTVKAHTTVGTVSVHGN